MREWLPERRKALGLTQEALAELVEVERSTVARWERGTTEPQLWIRPRLARALRITAERLNTLLADRPAESRPGGHAATVPRQLPGAVGHFTGRSAELQALTRIVDDADSVPGTVVISAIGGTAGVGKTALALHWAHRIADRFCDGQLYMNLRGFDPSGVPATSGEVIRGFLVALGVPPGRLPHTQEGQAGLYRGLLSQRRMLIVLDNARDEQQVRPLLPASPASLILVTSRNQLSGLAAAEGARLLSLDVLTQGESIQLLTARLGADRAVAEPDAVAEIAARCAGLPLGLAVVAARAATHPRFPLAALAAELRDSTSRWDALDSGAPAACVRAVFGWSYEQLGEESARMFRLLGLHPGPEVTAPAAASLAGCQAPDARRLLRELARDCLISEPVPGRYAFHDLLRAYAADLAGDCDSAADREAATGRLLDHYLHTAYAAAQLMRPHREPITLAPPARGTTPEVPAEPQQARAWFEAEHPVLVAVVMATASNGCDVHAWQLPWAMMPFLETSGRHKEWEATQRIALTAATRLGDTAAQAVSSRMLANALTVLGDRDQARTRLEHSLALYRQLGNRFGEAKTYQDLNVLAERQGRNAEALGHAEQALALFQAIGHKAAEAEMLNGVGWLHALLGDYQRARLFCQQALTRLAELDHRRLEACAWDSLGYAEHHLGNLSEAASCFQHALGIFREFGDRYLEAMILTHLADARHAAGELTQARDAWAQALTILDDLRLPDADDVRAKLASAEG